jgi:dipeptidyl aminopeptidase/acylaminoacyl peptidase
MAQPHFLSAETGSAAALFTYFSDKPTLMLLDVRNRRHQVIGSGSNPFYSSTGHLLYRSGTDLWCRLFDAKRAQFTGEAFRVARNATDPTIASDGTLVYREEPAQQLVWLDRSGARIGTVGLPANRIYYPALSPDGRRVAVEAWEEENKDVWVSDVLRASRIRLTFHPATDILPVWAPEGDHVAFSSYREGNTDILVRRADAGLEETTLAAMPQNERVSDWSYDGRYILYSLKHPRNGDDLWYLERNAAGKWKPHPLLETPFDERSPKLSPDGKFMAYLSDESGRHELYVRPFPSGGRKWPISTNGASQIRWSRRSGELFYTEAGTLMAVPVRTAPEFAAGATDRLFSHAAFTISPFDSNYDVSPDGQRIILPERVGTQQPVIHVVQNWFAEFRGRR